MSMSKDWLWEGDDVFQQVLNGPVCDADTRLDTQMQRDFQHLIWISLHSSNTQNLLLHIREQLRERTGG